MFMRIATATLLLAASTTLAVAQSTTATPLTTAPAKSAPSAGAPAAQPKFVPPSARSGEQGLRVGNDAAQESTVEIKQKK